MLLLIVVLALEFEYRRGEILKLFETIKRITAESAYCNVGRHNSTRVDEGRNI